MIEVEGPDGIIYEFPDGTDDATMANALQRVYGAPTQAAQPSGDSGLGGDLWSFLTGNDADGRWAGAGRTTADWLNRAAESMSFGLVGDEANARFDDMIGRGTYDDRLAQYRQGEKNLGTWGRLSADLVGGIAPALAGVGLVSGAANLPQAALRGAAMGAGAGGVQGFMEGEGGVADRLAGAGIGIGLGAGLGAAAPVATAKIGDLASGFLENRAIRQTARNAPSTEDLRAMGNAAYRAIDDAGVRLQPDAVREAASNVVEALTRQGLDNGPMSLTPQAARLAQVLTEAVPEGSTGVPFSAVELLRRKAGVPASNLGNRVESALGSRAIEGMDDFVRNLTPDQVVSGSADDLASNIATARDIWSRMSRSQLIDDAIEQSENYLGGGASGMRNQFARILRNQKLSRGFSETEKKAMRRVVNGSIPEQLLNLAGGGIGQIAAIGGGAAGGGPVGAVAGAMLGSAARRGSEALTRRNAEVVRALIAAGGVSEAPAISAASQRVLDALGFDAALSAQDRLQSILR